MKRRNAFLFLFGCLGVAGAQFADAHATKGEVMVLVKENVDRESKAKHSGSQTVTLDITINGKPKDPEKRTIKWTAFGKDQKSGSVVTMESGEFPVNLSSGSMQKTTTKKLVTSYKEEHTQSSSSGGGRGRSRRIKFTKVPGEGVKYYGYGVQVMEGEAVVGEKFDPKSIEDKRQAGSS